MTPSDDSPSPPHDSEPPRGDGEDGGDEGAEAGAEGGEPRRRRRRRRRREPGEAAAAPEATASERPREGEPGRARRDYHARFAGQPPTSGEAAAAGPAPAPAADKPAEPRGERRERGRRGERREARGGGEPRRNERPERAERQDRPRTADRRPSAPTPPAATTTTFEPPTARLEPRRAPSPPPTADDLDLEPAAPAIAWGKDDDGPPPTVALAADLPTDAPADDHDPLTHPLLDLPSPSLGDDVASVVGVRFVTGGRVQWCDAGDVDYARGERVLVDAERGSRLAWIAVPPARRAVRDRGLRRVIRRASDHDLRGERDGDADRAHALRIAKDKAAALRLPIKVFRVEVAEARGGGGRGGRINVYFTTDERLDLRDFLRDVGNALGGGRVELRQLGVRDEAKAVGGIGSCGLTLCCTTWLPDFVPVSIKMAKDQGLVLSPTKVSGQCGRLKCCLVYEQAAYAELRKGLPKLGKRVIGARGEGRVVEVDVLRQRVRVSYGPGDTEVVGAGDVRPLFPSGNPPRGGAPADADPDADDAPDPEPTPEPALPADRLDDLPALPDED